MDKQREKKTVIVKNLCHTVENIMLDLTNTFEGISLPTCRDILISSVTEERTGVNQYTPTFFKAGVLLQSMLVFKEGILSGWDKPACSEVFQKLKVKFLYEIIIF